MPPFTVTTPIPGAAWGALVAGIDFATPGALSSSVAEALRQELHRHRILLFRNQPPISGQRLAEVSRLFGAIDNSAYFKHPASPTVDVFRVSNDRREGCTEVGRTGWHVDGSFFRRPYSVAVYHIVSAPTKGCTRFAPLRELFQGAPMPLRDRWRRVWVASDRREGPVHPLVYPHPATGELTMLFHLGMTEAVLWGSGDDGPDRVSAAEDAGVARAKMAADAREVLGELLSEVTGERMRPLVYSHQWQEGDLILSDNLAVAHEADPDTQLDRREVGLRVLHRVTLEGTAEPGALRKASGWAQSGGPPPPSPPGGEKDPCGR